MGIPFYFKEVVAKNPKILAYPPKCHRLSLDFNSVIHQASQKVVQSKVWRHSNRMEEAIFRAILHETHQIIQLCPPSHALYIAIDGIAPLAKISQQRKRRHLSALTNQQINSFKDKNNMPYSQWDSNCITPGTAFMTRLTGFLKAHFEHAQYPFQVILSGPDEPGEGEHKIIKYIKEQDPIHIDTIYGMDADLIMLALTCQKPKIFLMRDRDFVSIDTLRQSIPNLHDYVALCFLLGNDFLPHFFALDLKYNGLDILLDALKVSLVDQGNLDKSALMTLLQTLAVKEEALIKSNIQTYLDAPYFDKSHPTLFDKFMYELNFRPLMHRRKQLDMDDPFWRSTYYKTFLNVAYNDIAQVDEVCKNYLEGLTWNLTYYLKNETTNAWYYKYDSAPLLQDLLRYLQKHPELPTPAPSHLTLTPHQQLALVLPYQSLHLLPTTPKHMHMYPVAFKLKTFLKAQLWECTPILPPLNLKYVLASDSSPRSPPPCG